MIPSSREPLFFYHLLPKNITLDKFGIVSPEFFWRNDNIEEYLKAVDKYRNRLVYDWKIYPNKKPEELTPQEIYNGINIFRRDREGNNRIYLFRYLPYKELGPNMEKLLENKKAYQIDIESSLSRKYIEKIDWGYWMSFSGNRKLNRHYFAHVSEEEYFQYYNDNDNPLFKSLNHIAIIPKLSYMPISVWEEIDIE